MLQAIGGRISLSAMTILKPINLFHMLEFMMICNDADLAAQAVVSGVDRIFIDLETMGKHARQRGRNTVISSHSLDDVKAIRSRLPDSDILVRCNPLHSKSGDEIDDIIVRGADVVMLPMFTTRAEVERMIELVNGRTKICLLVETAQALTRLPNILELSDHLHEVYFGLNDLHISLGLDFMFESLAGGLVELGMQQVRRKGVRTGFGGIGRMGMGAIPAEHILGEHVRLGSSVVILSRVFSQGGDIESMEGEIRKLRDEEKRIRTLLVEDLEDNRVLLCGEIWDVVSKSRKSP